MNKICFISFASTNMKVSLDRIGKQAKSLKIFSKVYLYTEKKLPAYSKKRCKQIIKLTGTRRGYAYWSWKPVIINEVFNKIEDGDVIIYSDSGTHINPNGKEKLLEYIEMAKQNDIWCVQLESGLFDLNWTKMDTINYFRANNVENKDEFEKALFKGQLEGGTIIAVKNNYTSELFKKWESLMTIENLHLFDDSPSKNDNYSSFVENRHDQSLFSLLLKSNHFIAVENKHVYSSDKYPNGEWKKLIENEPFLRLRDVDRDNSLVNRLLILRILRKLKHMIIKS